MFDTTYGKLMFCAGLIGLTVGTHGVHGQTPSDQTAAPAATFRSSVDLVRVAAVVRDHKGRFVQDLTVRDFEVIDGGQNRRDHGLPPGRGGRQHRAAVRRQRQHARPVRPGARSRDARVELARSRRWTKRPSSVSTRGSRNRCPSRAGCGFCRRRCPRSRRSVRRRSSTPSGARRSGWRHGRDGVARSSSSPTATTTRAA